MLITVNLSTISEFDSIINKVMSCEHFHTKSIIFTKVISVECEKKEENFEPQMKVHDITLVWCLKSL